MPWVTLSGGFQVQLTHAQLSAAHNWVSRTLFDESPKHITQVFPERDNWANGQRRCCHRLVELEVLQGTSAEGYVLEPTLRRKLMQRM